MSPNHLNNPLSHPAPSGPERDGDAQQWDQYLAEEAVWDHFLSFSPEAMQWTYNIQ